MIKVPLFSPLLVTFRSRNKSSLKASVTRALTKIPFQ